MGRGLWKDHACAGGNTPSHVWHAQWCHLEKPDAEPREGACGKCARHCQCQSRVRNDLPTLLENETVQQFTERLMNSKRDVFTQHNSE